MAYRLIRSQDIVKFDLPIKTGLMACYDTIGERAFDYDRDFLLHERSMFELVRDQLSVGQRKELEDIDAYWRANAADFNADFATLHFQEDKATALEGFVQDENGVTPAIPRDHWWWRPIEEADA